MNHVSWIGMFLWFLLVSFFFALICSTRLLVDTFEPSQILFILLQIFLNLWNGNTFRLFLEWLFLFKFMDVLRGGPIEFLFSYVSFQIPRSHKKITLLSCIFILRVYISNLSYIVWHVYIWCSFNIYLREDFGHFGWKNLGDCLFLSVQRSAVILCVVVN